MEIYNETGKLKSGEQRITRPIGALLLTMSQPFSGLTNETITAYVERSNGDNTDICTDMKLSAFIALSTAGDPAVYEDETHTRAFLEICEEGSINLQENESIKLKLDNLKADKTYTLHGIETPVLADSVVKIDKKNILSGESQRRISIAGEELMVIDGIDEIIEMNVAYSTGLTCKYVPEELKALSRDLDAVKLVKVGASAEAHYDLGSYINFPLQGVLNVDIKKKTGNPIDLYLKNDVTKY